VHRNPGVAERQPEKGKRPVMHPELPASLPRNEAHRGPQALGFTERPLRYVLGSIFAQHTTLDLQRMPPVRASCAPK